MRNPCLSQVVARLIMFMAPWQLAICFAMPLARAEPADEPRWTAQQRAHWSYVPPARPDVPKVENGSWVKNPIDAFILGELEAVEVPPAPGADRVTLIRRLTFDLTGLPPTPSEVDDFLADTEPGAYERLVDRLLESDRYGERWGRFWLDLARFAESDGFKSDKTRPYAWRYRDWVIRALNDDMPYDRFVKLQLAGDEYAPGDSDAFLATGFNRNWPFEDNNMVPGLNRQLILEDMTDTTASVFLGMTLACARCHNHKYDPISQKDYYRFQALFSSAAAKDDAKLGPPLELAFAAAVEAEHEARLERLRKSIATIEQPYLATLLKDILATLPGGVKVALETEPVARTAFQEDILKRYAKQMAVAPSKMTSAMKPEDRRAWTELTGEMKAVTESLPPGPDLGSGMVDASPKPFPVFLLQKGAFGRPVEEVGPGFPSIFASVLPAFEEHTTATSSGRRVAFAEWLTRADHPLTARVMVNRLWQNHFGRGIVASASDFGSQGTEPSHPELLDWLATEFVSQGWSMKAMHRLMVTSATYRQSSTPTTKAAADDPENALFSRMFRRRLEGEAVRDALLAVSGRLDTRVGGPSVFPDLPPGMVTRGGWTRSDSASDRDRRSVYVFVRRNLKYPLFDAFDAPDTNTTCPERNVSVNAPQALMLLNSDLVLDLARSLAGRLLGGASDRNDLEEIVSSAYRLTVSRAPRRDERARGVAFLEEQPAILSARADDPKSLGLPNPMPDGYGPARGAALVDYCHVLLNLNEFVFVD